MLNLWPGDLFIKDQREAWATYHAHPGQHGAPMRVGDGYLLTGRVPKVVNEVLAREAVAIIGQVSAAPSPGSSAKKAKLTAEDRRRISAQVDARAKQRRPREERDEGADGSVVKAR